MKFYEDYAPVENIFDGIGKRSKGGKVRKEYRQGLWGQSDDLDLTYTPFTITKVNGSPSIADFFNQQPLPILTQDQDESASNYSKENPTKFDIQKKFNDFLKDWKLEKCDKDNYVSDEEWSNIVALVKFSLSPRFIYATTYGNNIYIDSMKKKGEVIELGTYEPESNKITLYTTAIRETASDYNLSFELMAAQVFLHELGHYVMDVGKSTNKTAEESCANLISLLCMEQLVKNNNITVEDYDTIVRFMHDQPKEYQLGPELMEENSWEWLKWMIFKGKYTGYIHKMENEECCILSVDGKEMYFKN